jgi:hypothetical protein
VELLCRLARLHLRQDRHAELVGAGKHLLHCPPHDRAEDQVVQRTGTSERIEDAPGLEAVEGVRAKRSVRDERPNRLLQSR